MKVKVTANRSALKQPVQRSIENVFDFDFSSVTVMHPARLLRQHQIKLKRKRRGKLELVINMLVLN